MKKLVALFSTALFLVAVILLPTTSIGKCDVSKPLTADGWPLPPLPPGPGGALIADGWPLPPLPPGGGTATLTADGWPLPPLPPGPGTVLTLSPA